MVSQDLLDLLGRRVIEGLMGLKAYMEKMD
jgi:hypothetical protein